MIGTQEAGEATQEASQVTEEAFRQVSGLEPITPGLQARFQEGDGGVEALPESVHEVGFGASPAATEVEGPTLSLLEAIRFIDPPEVAAQVPLVQPVVLLQQPLQGLQPVAQARLELGLGVDDLRRCSYATTPIGHDQRHLLQASLVEPLQQCLVGLPIFLLRHLPVQHPKASSELHPTATSRAPERVRRRGLRR